MLLPFFKTMKNQKSKKSFFYFVITLLLILWVGQQTGDLNKVFDELITESSKESFNSATHQKPSNDNKIIISDYAKKHILYGNKSGGGHKHGTGKPCKSEFPKNWNDKKIISTIQTLAANDNNQWKKEGNGYHTIEKTVEGIDIRVVIGKKKKNIITAYPTNTQRNPCTFKHNN